MKKLIYVALGLGVAVLAVGCATRSPVPQMVINVSIDREVDAAANGRATLSPGQFAFNPTLSTFAPPAVAPVLKACKYRFTVVGVPTPVVVGASGPVQGLPGYVATFNDQPPGHWDMAIPPGQTAASAAAGVSAYAQQNRGNLQQGTSPVPCY